MFAVPSLVSLYLLASSPSLLAEKSSQPRSLSRDRVQVAGVFFDFFMKYNPDSPVAGRHFSSVSKRNNEVVLVTGRQ